MSTICGRESPHGHGPARRVSLVVALAAVAVMVVVALCSGCSTRSALRNGDARIESSGAEKRVLATEFTTAVYTRTQETEYSLFLTDIPVEELLDGNPRDGHVLHIELLWIPKAGATPVEATATNISITSIVFSGDDVGVYGGAGFAVPSGQIGDGRLTLGVRDATLVLIDATDGFVDLLSPARLVGSVSVDLDAARSRRLRFAVAQEMTNRLGRTRVIRTQDGIDDLRQGGQRMTMGMHGPDEVGPASRQ